MKTRTQTVCLETSLLTGRMKAIILMTALLLSVILCSGGKMYAAEGFVMFTDSSGMNVKAGEALSFDLYISNNLQSESDVSLSVENMPEGFSGFFKRGNYEVSKVHAGSNSAESVATFQLTVPTEAAQGEYVVTLKAVSDTGAEDYLDLTLNVTELEAGESNFVVEYPQQEGITGTTFTYSTTIANNTLTNQTYNFSYEAPSGWTVAFKSSSDSTQISSIDIESGSSAGITITVTSPENAQAGDYKINCSAVSAKDKLTSTLGVKLLGTYDIEVSTVDDRLSFDAYANKQADVTLRITNNGNIDLEDIDLSSTAPTGWEVTFDESVIEELKAGSSTDIKAYITPSSDALTGDYLTYITAGNSDQTDTAEFRVTVKTQTSWGIVAILIIAGVVAGLWYITKRYGRR